jgi:hypothetical protein
MPVFGQQPASQPAGQSAPDPNNQTPPDQPPADDGPKIVQPRLLPGERPPTPEELRKQEIDAHDPLARDPRSKDPHLQDPRQPDTDATEDPNRDLTPRQQAPAPLPGSIADSNLNPTLRNEGPQILENDPNSPDQQYNGPAVLSRSYTLTRPMVPKQVRWSWTVSGGQNYSGGLVTGSSTSTAPTGTVPNSSSYGTSAAFAVQGRHLWKRDQIGLSYTGGYNRYASVTSYNGVNQNLNIDYGHQFSRHLSLNIVESASTITQNGTLTNPLAEPGVSVANINLAASPTVQPFDQVTRQSTTQISVTWQKSARLSFSLSAGLFGVERTGAQLSGDSGYQGQTDMNYRLTRKTTVGVYYSYVTYVFSHHLADSDTNTVGAIYSYALGRSMQIRTRAGISRIENSGLTEVPVDPVIAALTGQAAAIVASYHLSYTSDISGQLIKDFGERRTGSISYAHGVSPGNGQILTSTQQVISATYSMLLFRHYTVSAGIGQTALSATLGAAGNTVSDYITLSLSRTLRHNVATNLGFSYRTYSAAGQANVQPQFVISSGVSWGPGEGKLW